MAWNLRTRWSGIGSDSQRSAGQDDEEIGQIQTLGRMAILLGGISVGYLSGVLAGAIGPRNTFAVAMARIVSGPVRFSVPARNRLPGTT